MTPKENHTKIMALEQRLWRMEKVIWYVAGILSIKFGAEALPIVRALFMF